MGDMVYSLTWSNRHKGWYWVPNWGQTTWPGFKAFHESDRSIFADDSRWISVRETYGYSPLAMAPSQSPTAPIPTVTPGSPTTMPIPVPTAAPVPKPTSEPSSKPTTAKPTFSPSATPSSKPTPYPTAKPTFYPSAKPTPKPTAVPTVRPTSKPTKHPSSCGKGCKSEKATKDTDDDGWVPSSSSWNHLKGKPKESEMEEAAAATTTSER